MGLFDLFKKPKPMAPTFSSPQSAPAPENALNLKKEEAMQVLNLRKETFALSLRKNQAEHLVARVAVAMDDSGSMEYLYKNGTVQSVIDRLLPVALRLDDNGELDMWLFSNGAKRMPSITEQEFFGYVDREVMRKASWGGTNYAPVINDIVKKYAREEPSNVPTLVIFITDGENSDRADAKHAITQASKYNIFFQFVGIGDEDFKFLKTLDTMEGRYIDNANFFEIQNIHRISDDQLYDLLLTEYPSWEKEARRVGLIK